MDAILHSLSKSEKPMSLYWVLQTILAMRKRHVYVSADIEDPNNLREGNRERDQKSIKITW